VIRSQLDAEASPHTLHELLVDVDAWPLWSPHVASLDAPSRRITPGWVGRPRAFFAPMAVAMEVDRVDDDGGYLWHSTLGPWRLDYSNRVWPNADGGSTVAFSATLSGPAAAVLERIVGPVSAWGQRRRIARLVQLGALVERST